MTSPQILGSARAGDPAALEALYRELAPVVLGYLRAQGAKEPEDLTGDTFVGVVRGLHRFQGDRQALRSWVFAIAHRRLLDERRRLARRREEAVDPRELPERIAGDVEQDALVRVGARWAVDALAGLTPDQRDVLLLRVLADLSVGAVAGILRKGPGAVKSLQRRALLALARQIDPEAVS